MKNEENGMIDIETSARRPQQATKDQELSAALSNLPLTELPVMLDALIGAQSALSAIQLQPRCGEIAGDLIASEMERLSHFIDLLWKRIRDAALSAEGEDLGAVQSAWLIYAAQFFDPEDTDEKHRIAMALLKQEALS
ncbi:MAG: hypothetical protein CMJ43_02795 [Phyllobacteriaceae bacterium]|nr:hypothetical protein [Phyllobacteriaceae bacterium]